MRTLRVAALGFLLSLEGLAASGCGHAAVPMRPADDRVHEAWLEPVLGQNADVVIIVRVRALLNDENYGPLLTKLAHDAFHAETDAGMLHAVMDCDEIDLEASGNTSRPETMPWILVMRGVPADVDVLAIMKQGRPVFSAIGRSSAGVDTYVAREGVEGSELLVFPDHTWILAAKDVAPRLAAASTPPPSIALEPQALVATYMSGAILRHLVERGAPEEQALLDGLEGVTLATATTGHGGDISSTSHFFYADSSTAEKAKGELDALLAKWRAMSTKDATVAIFRGISPPRRDGRVVEVQLQVPASLLMTLVH